MHIIKKLSESTINRIAAGEVVERPSSVIKELVENSIDAGSKNISIRIEASGKNLIVISDDGLGMSKEDILLAIERHTTSKLQEDNIMNIEFFGFRGEALPSIASVSNMQITSTKRGNATGHKIKLSSGVVNEISEILASSGTKIEVRDLFFTTPARLKFLKSDKSEQNACVDVIKRISFAHPEISFSLISDDKEIFNTASSTNYRERLEDILGKDFLDNSAEINLERENFKLSGFTTIPTYNRASSSEQYLYVNNRPVKDKLLSVALKVAYQDYLSRDRYPASVIFIETLPQYVDVNVHPAKTEVRFRDSAEVRGLLISAIKDALQRTSHNSSSILPNKIIEKVISSYNVSDAPSNFGSYTSSYNSFKTSYSKPNHSTSSPHQAPNFLADIRPILNTEKINLEEVSINQKHKLGAAIGQIHNTYIFAQTEDGLIIVDQHAAHERLVYEKIKKQLLTKQMPSQRLIIPAIVNLPDEFSVELIIDKIEYLSALGLVIQRFGPKSVAVREVPSLLGEFNIEKLILDLADNFKELGENIALQELIEHVTETYACHYSIRAGRSMSVSEMNDLLREMEETPFSGQCNHGRPTYVKLTTLDLEKLFGRK